MRHLNCSMQLKQFYNIATKVSSRKKVLLLLVIYLTEQFYVLMHPQSHDFKICYNNVTIIIQIPYLLIQRKCKEGISSSKKQGFQATISMQINPMGLDMVKWCHYDTLCIESYTNLAKASPRNGYTKVPIRRLKHDMIVVLTVIVIALIKHIYVALFLWLHDRPLGLAMI